MSKKQYIDKNGKVLLEIKEADFVEYHNSSICVEELIHNVRSKQETFKFKILNFFRMFRLNNLKKFIPIVKIYWR